MLVCNKEPSPEVGVLYVRGHTVRTGRQQIVRVLAGPVLRDNEISAHRRRLRISLTYDVLPHSRDVYTSSPQCIAREFRLKVMILQRSERSHSESLQLGTAC